RKRWAELDYERGKLGMPTGPEIWSGKGWYQSYEKGFIIGTGRTGYWESMGEIRKRWAELDYERGKLGMPTDGIKTNEDGLESQDFEGGYISNKSEEFVEYITKNSL
ncbi:MAG: hypothetical protein Q4A21_03340, partial [bacterium]|nr:hypothetical protein [bacterium]